MNLIRLTAAYSEDGWVIVNPDYITLIYSAEAPAGRMTYVSVLKKRNYLVGDEIAELIVKESPDEIERIIKKLNG